MRKTFLYQVWHHNKKLCCLLTGFALLTLLANLTGKEITPFFVWGMYSEKEQPVQQYQLLRTTINDSVVINPYDVPTTNTRLYLQGPLAYYKRIKDNNGEDPTASFLKSKLGTTHHQQIDALMQRMAVNTPQQQQQFLTWYAAYLQQATTHLANSVQVNVVHVHYAGQQLIVDSLQPFATWKRKRRI